MLGGNNRCESAYAAYTRILVITNYVMHRIAYSYIKNLLHRNRKSGIGFTVLLVNTKNFSGSIRSR